MFTKRIASESAAVVRPENLLRQVFASLGVEAAFELDVRRMAKRLGITLPDLSSLCEKLPDGRIKVK